MSPSDNVRRALGLIVLSLIAGLATSCGKESHAEKESPAPPASGAARTAASPPVAQRQIPESNRVTIAARDMPLDEVLAKVSEQVGWTVERQFPGFKGEELPVTIELKQAPVLKVLGELCARNRWFLSEVMDGRGAKSFHVETKDAETPIRACQAQGPLLLTWHGLCTTLQHNFDDPQRSPKVTRYRLGYYADPLACLEVGDGRQAPREIPVTFDIDGKEVDLHSDHRPHVFESGVQFWEFDPAKLSGKRIGLRLKLPILAPTRLASAFLSFKNGAEETVEGVKVSLSEARSEEVDAQDPKDPFKMIKVRDWKIEAQLIHSQAGSGTLPLDRLLVRPRKVHAMGRGGRRIAGHATGATGISGPMIGFRYELTFRAPDCDFAPTSIDVQWAMDYERRECAFEIHDLPLD